MRIRLKKNDQNHRIIQRMQKLAYQWMGALMSLLEIMQSLICKKALSWSTFSEFYLKVIMMVSC